MELLCFERVSAEGLISRNRILSPPRLPFRHSGSLRFYTTRAACQRLARGRLSDYTARWAAWRGPSSCRRCPHEHDSQFNNVLGRTCGNSSCRRFDAAIAWASSLLAPWILYCDTHAVSGGVQRQCVEVP